MLDTFKKNRALNDADVQDVDNEGEDTLPQGNTSDKVDASDNEINLPPGNPSDVVERGL